MAPLKIYYLQPKLVEGGGGCCFCFNLFLIVWGGGRKGEWVGGVVFLFVVVVFVLR